MKKPVIIQQDPKIEQQESLRNGVNNFYERFVATDIVKIFSHFAHLSTFVKEIVLIFIVQTTYNMLCEL